MWNKIAVALGIAAAAVPAEDLLPCLIFPQYESTPRNSHTKERFCGKMRILAPRYESYDRKYHTAEQISAKRA